MNFPSVLHSGRFIERHKRFLVTVHLDSGEKVLAHCPNTGSMTGLLVPGEKVYVSETGGSERETAYTWELVEKDGHLVGVDTMVPRRLFRKAFEKKALPLFEGYTALKAAAKHGNARIDFLLTGKTPLYVDVKSVQWIEGKTAYFPDSVTTRGSYHLQELLSVVEQEGARGAVVYVVQTEAAQTLCPAGFIDPVYGRLFEQAQHAGIEFLAYTCHISLNAINLGHAIPVSAPTYREKKS